MDTLLSYMYLGQMGQSYGIPCVPLHRAILCVRPIPLSYVGQMGQSYGIPCVPLHRPILCVRPIPLSYVGQMGQSYGIPCVPLHRPILCVRPIPLSYVGRNSPMESHVYHCTGQSYVSILSHCPTWDGWDSLMESHVYHCTVNLITLGVHAQRGLQCLFVCLSVCLRLFSHYRLRGGL